jgi:hypothetical protein
MPDTAIESIRDAHVELTAQDGKVVCRKNKKIAVVPAGVSRNLYTVKASETESGLKSDGTPSLRTTKGKALEDKAAHDRETKARVQKAQHDREARRMRERRQERLQEQQMQQEQQRLQVQQRQERQQQQRRVQQQQMQQQRLQEQEQQRLQQQQQYQLPQGLAYGGGAQYVSVRGYGGYSGGEREVFTGARGGTYYMSGGRNRVYF